MMPRLRLLPFLLAVVPLAGASLALGDSATTAPGTTTAPSTTAPAPTTPTTPAPPASFTFNGRGWGHGVGMSQWGARGRALAGWSGGRILQAYYPGTRFGKAKPRAVRVLLAPALRGAVVWSPSPWRLVGRRRNGRNLTPLRPGAIHTIVALPDGTLGVDRGSRRIAVITGPLSFQARSAGGWVAWGARLPQADRRYRGALRAVPVQGGFDLVNVVGMEDYLKGVVPREMPASWGNDAFGALVAQAVAARSYALSTMSPTAGYDLFDDQRSQVYGGITSEDPRSTKAVVRTRGTVLTYGGAVITAYFFSTSGGQTEDVQNIFRASPPRPYLVSVSDPFDSISPYHVWPDHPTFTAAELGQRLHLDGPVSAVSILQRGASPRVVQARVTTASGQATDFAGTDLRRLLGLRDTWFDVVPNPPAAATASR